MNTTAPKSRLFQRLAIRGLTLRNRVVISPMCQYSATDGMADGWHFVHLGQFAIAGAGLVFTEAAAVEARGRITHGDLGIWSDAHSAALKPVAAFIAAQGAAPGIQIAHAGRKASMQRPWYGNGPLTDTDTARGDRPWQVVAASAIPVAEGWLMPHELSLPEIADIQRAFTEATRRADAAGFEVLELHGAHGYLTHTFLSPISNRRNDGYGGDRAGRMRFALETAAAVRAAWPERKPLFFRVSSVDGVEGGWSIEDSVALASELKARGVDVIDCSSGGIGGPATAAGVPRGPGFQIPYAERLRRDAGIVTQAVGLILTPEQAEAALAAGQADLIAIAREALFDPHWVGRAALALEDEETAWSLWPKQYGWWLERRAKAMPRKPA